MEYTIQTAVTGEFDDVVDTTIAALKDEGFGVPCDIDIQATLKEKLGEEFRQYRISGACNPPLAYEGLTEEIELGALLPCNVIVYENDDGDIVVSAVDPSSWSASQTTMRSTPSRPRSTSVSSVFASVADEFEPASEVW